MRLALALLLALLMALSTATAALADTYRFVPPNPVGPVGIVVGEIVTDEGAQTFDATLTVRGVIVIDVEGVAFPPSPVFPPNPIELRR